MSASNQVFLDDAEFMGSLDAMGFTNDRQDGAPSDDQAEAAVASIEAKHPAFKVTINFRKGCAYTLLTHADDATQAEAQALRDVANDSSYTSPIKGKPITRPATPADFE